MAFEMRVQESAQKEAFAELYRNDIDRVYGFLYVRTGSHSVAEDLAAEVFSEAARRFAQDRGDEVSSAWLTTVARRRLIDHWRRVERLRSRMDRLRRERVPLDVTEEPSDERVLHALDSLPPRQRACLVLRYIDGFSVLEVAEQLELTYHAAESVLARARRSFRASFEEMA